MNFQIKDWKSAVTLGIIILVAVVVIWLLISLNKKFFKKLKKDHKNIHLTLIEKVVNIAIFIIVSLLAFSAVGGTKTLWQTLLGGTAVISAVAAFAAQDVIKDMLAGMMISIYKPFDIGDRIELEDGTAGVVKDMTMRHVVINTVDTIKEVIPNSKLNTMLIKNYSFNQPLRSVNFKFPIGYDSDVEKAKKVIFESVKESEFSRPFTTDENGNEVYKPVYFLQFEDSALIMSVTVYYERDVATEVVKNDINTSVREALIGSGIEIPYNYITVVKK